MSRHPPRGRQLKRARGSFTGKSDMSLRGRTAITGIGETAYVRGAGKSAFQLQVEASLHAIEDAGLTPKQIDGIIPIGITGAPAEEFVTNFGIPDLRFSALTPLGGASGVAAAGRGEVIVGRLPTMPSIRASRAMSPTCSPSSNSRRACAPSDGCARFRQARSASVCRYNSRPTGATTDWRCRPSFLLRRSLRLLEGYLVSQSAATMSSRKISLDTPSCKLSEAWEAPGAPDFLPTPLQGILYNEAHARVVRAKRRDLYSFPVGQAVGTITSETSVREEMYRLQLEYLETMERLRALEQPVSLPH